MTYQFQNRSDVVPAETSFQKKDLDAGVPMDIVVFRSGIASTEADAKQMLKDGLIRQKGKDDAFAGDAVLKYDDVGEDGAVITGPNAVVRRIRYYL